MLFHSQIKIFCPREYNSVDLDNV